jgi:hypothetical protein
MKPVNTPETDTRWVEHVLNPKTITSLYPAQPPSLSQVELVSLDITCGGDLQCRLHLVLHDFPADTPNKWVKKGCNAVALSLSLSQVALDLCVIPSGSGVGDLSLVHDGTGFNIAFATPAHGVVFRARATWISVDISAYIDERRINK